MKLKKWEAILVAIIGGVFMVLTNISGLWYTAHQTEESDYPNIEIVSVESVLDEEYYYLSDIDGNMACPPYIDITLINKGEGTGIINKLDLEIIDASLNTTPVLKYDFFDDYINSTDNRIRARIINEGWGPANHLQWRCLINVGEYTDQLKIASNPLNWNGDVNPGEAFVINFTFRPQDGFFVSFSDLNETVYNGYVYTQVYKGQIHTNVVYKDVGGVEAADNFETYIYLYKKDRPATSEEVWGMCVSCAEGMACKVEPVKIFYIDLVDPEMKCPTTISFNVQHALRKEDIDRIILKINSTEKSGEIKYRVKVMYNSPAPAYSGIKHMGWVSQNKNYIKNTKLVDIYV